MKHLRLFDEILKESSKDDFYKKMSHSKVRDFKDSHKMESITENEKDIFKKILVNSIPSYDIITKSQENTRGIIYLRCYIGLANVDFYESLRTFTFLLIVKYDDEWWNVTIAGKGEHSSFYLCDGIEGVKELFNDKDWETLRKNRLEYFGVY